MIDKRILNIVQNNPEILVDKGLIQIIFIRYLRGYSASKDKFQNYFNELYKDGLLDNNKAKEEIRTRLLSKLDSREKSLVNNINEIISELSKQGLFKKVFDLNFVVLNSAQGIITNILKKFEPYLRGHAIELFNTIKLSWNLSSNKEAIDYINHHKSKTILFIKEQLEDKYLEDIFTKDVIVNSPPLSLLEHIDENETRKLAEFFLSTILDYIKQEQIEQEHREKREKERREKHEENIRKAIFSLDKLNLEIDESIVLDAVMFHNMTLDKSIPIIYVNGNVIADFTTPVNGNERKHHSVLFKRYCEDMSLHKNDQIKKTKEEWENLTKNLEPDDMEMYQLMNDYKCVRAVQPTNGKAVAIIVSFGNAKEAAKAFQAQLPNCGNVFAFDESMTFLERKAKFKRLMKKIG